MDLKPLTRGKGDNRYCGPAVISFVTGISTADAAALIRKQTGRRMITGTYPSEVRNALRALGYDWVRHRVADCGTHNPTLAAWLKGTQDIRTAGRVFLVIAGNHWQLITGRRYACGRIGQIVSIKDERVKRRARVAMVLELHELQGGAPTRRETIAALTRATTQKRTEAAAKSSDRTYVKRLAAQHGISVEVDNWGEGRLSIYCFPPDWFQKLREEGLIEGFVGDSEEVVGYSWSEARDVIDRQVEAMAAAQKQRAA